MQVIGCASTIEPVGGPKVLSKLTKFADKICNFEKITDLKFSLRQISVKTKITEFLALY